METIKIDTKQLEKVILTNWTTFINPNNLIKTILSSVRDSTLNSVKGEVRNKSLKITMSSFQMEDAGFTVWFDFVIPKQGGVAVGTCEMRSDRHGTLTVERTVGSLLGG